VHIRIEGSDLPGRGAGARSLGDVHVGVQRKSEVVDRVSADMMLGFFFPGAEMVLTGAAAAQAAQAAATSAQTTTTDALAPAPSAAAETTPPAA